MQLTSKCAAQCHILMVALCVFSSCFHKTAEGTAADTDVRMEHLEAGSAPDKFLLPCEGGRLTVPASGDMGRWMIGLLACKDGNGSYKGVDKTNRVSCGYRVGGLGAFITSADTLHCSVLPNKSGRERTILLNMNFVSSDGCPRSRIIFIRQPSCAPARSDGVDTLPLAELRAGHSSETRGLKFDRDSFYVSSKGGFYEIVERGVVPDLFIDDILMKEGDGSFVSFCRQDCPGARHDFPFGEFSVSRDTLRCRIYPSHLSVERTVRVCLYAPAEWFYVTFVQKGEGDLP